MPHLTMIVRTKDQRLTFAEQRELRRFLQKPAEARSCCVTALPDPRCALLESLAAKQYIRLEKEANGFRYYQLAG